MTENKRFKVIETITNNDRRIYELTKNDIGYYNFKGEKLLAHMICNELNKLLEENEQLKQFKEDVFNKIDMHLRMLPTARDNEFNEDDGDPSLYTGAIYMLETLKKELLE